MGKAKYTSETKASVMAALLEGQAVSAVAAEYNIPVGTVKGWKSRGLNNSEVTKVPTQKKEELGLLIANLVEANVKAAHQIVETISDPAYIKQQPASEVAVLWGVINDKTFRMLEAFGQSDDDVEDSHADA